MDVTARIVRFVVGTKYEQIPPKAVETVKAAVLDCLGVALPGSKEASARICARIVRQESAKEETTVFGQGFKTSAVQAAFVNGTAAHALDFDHSLTFMGQPTSPIIPAVLSLGESLGVRGYELIEAYVAGFEATAKLAFLLRASAEVGWHAVGTLGSLGASAACAKLLRLNPSEVETALGISTSMAGGIVCNYGTMTKPLHAGLAARNGVLAAKLAQSGYKANAQAIEAKNGFFDMFYNVSPTDTGPLDELGQIYDLIRSGVTFKPYPCGGVTHSAIDAMLDIREKYRVTAEMVESIDVDVIQHTYNRIVFRIPQTGLEGKFCMPYLLSRAIIDGKVTLDTFTDSAVRDQHVLTLAERIHMRLDPNLKGSKEGSHPSKVTVHLRNGQTYSREVEHARGSPEVPLTPDELKTKFSECARQVLSARSTERALEYIERLETLEDIRPLCQLLLG